MIQFWNGFKSIKIGFYYIKKFEYFKYLIIPSLMSGSLIGLIGYFAIFQGLPYLDTLYSSNIESNFSDGFWLKFAKSFGVFLYIVVLILYALVSYLFYRFLLSILVQPFISILIQKLEDKLIPAEPEAFSLTKEIKLFLEGIRATIIYLVYSIFFFFLGFFLGPLQPILFLSSQAYILGRSSYDPVLETRFPSYGAKSSVLKTRKMEIIGLGFSQMLFNFIPIIGYFLAPVLGSIAAFHLYHKVNPEHKRG
ncbi:MAG: EI24 domain-containing protein [Leptospiraceae bacterium]|nr:EI24 domain-containing protein [Leptospiraceae bacterium]MCP5512883.1 EI24 domain-containing protein [Leptospiraceae bacterium]